MFRLNCLIAIVVLFGSAQITSAQTPVIKWSFMYPKPGTQTNHVGLAGTVDTTGGYTVTKLAAEAWVDGRKPTRYALTPAANWSGEIDIQSSGTTVNVWVEVWLTKNKVDYGPYRTKGLQTKSK